MSDTRTLRERIANYLFHGGLFNPEHMKHDNVRTLLLDIDTHLALLDQQEAASGWQPIETAPKDEPVWFWIVPKSPEEAYCNTSGDPIFNTHAPYRRFGKYGTWGALSKAIYWSPAPPDPPTPSGAKE